MAMPEPRPVRLQMRGVFEERREEIEREMLAMVGIPSDMLAGGQESATMINLREQERQFVAGFPVRTDPSIPRDTIRFRGLRGELLGTIHGIGGDR